jgi:hypothetical protein
MQGGKNSETLIGWKSGQTTFVPKCDRMEGAWLWILHGTSVRIVKKSPKVGTLYLYSPSLWTHVPGIHDGAGSRALLLGCNSRLGDCNCLLYKLLIIGPHP